MFTRKRYSNMIAMFILIIKLLASLLLNNQHVDDILGEYSWYLGPAGRIFQLLLLLFFLTCLLIQLLTIKLEKKNKLLKEIRDLYSIPVSKLFYYSLITIVKLSRTFSLVFYGSLAYLAYKSNLHNCYIGISYTLNVLNITYIVPYTFLLLYGFSGMCSVYSYNKYTTLKDLKSKLTAKSHIVFIIRRFHSIVQAIHQSNKFLSSFYGILYLICCPVLSMLLYFMLMDIGEISFMLKFLMIISFSFMFVNIMAHAFMATLVESLARSFYQPFNSFVAKGSLG